MALTILEAAKGSKMTEMQRSVIEIYAQSHEILRVLPMETISGNAVQFEVEGDLPTTDFRGYNEGYTESTGTMDLRTEALAIAGGEVDVDIAIVRQGGAERRASEMARKIKSLAHKVGHTMVKGDSITSRKEFDGLQNRCTGSRLIANSTASDGAVLSLSKLDEAIDNTDDPNGILLSKAMRRLLTGAARNTGVGGYITQSKDEFGRLIEFYRDLPLIVMDPNGSAYSTLGFNEAYSGGGTANGTSIYVVSMRPGMLTGIQSGPLAVKDFGEIAESPVTRARIEWSVGLKDAHPRCVTRLSSIKNGAVVA